MVAAYDYGGKWIADSVVGLLDLGADPWEYADDAPMAFETSDAEVAASP